MRRMVSGGKARQGTMLKTSQVELLMEQAGRPDFLLDFAFLRGHPAAP
jgi:hypothetical protein